MVDDTTASRALQGQLKPLLEELLAERIDELVIEPLQGDASSRRYSRLRAKSGNNEQTWMLVQYPRDERPADELGAGKVPAHRAFAQLAQTFRDAGLSVPAILHELDQGHTMILQDLGDDTFFAQLQKLPVAQHKVHYEQAIDLLATLHQRCWPLPDSHVVRSRSFDRELLRSELEHFREWGLQELFPNSAPQLNVTLDHLFDEVVDQVLQQPLGFVHRDYQSKNLMWHDKKLFVIDFQDALTGPRVYDLVALLCDSYVALDREFQLEMLKRYHERAQIRDRDWSQTQRDFWWLSVQRKLKDAGRFVFIDRVRKNPRFLGYYPQSLVYVGRALAELGKGEIAAQISEVIPGFPEKVAIPAAKS